MFWYMLRHVHVPSIRTGCRCASHRVRSTESTVFWPFCTFSRSRFRSRFLRYGFLLRSVLRVRLSWWRTPFFQTRFLLLLRYSYVLIYLSTLPKLWKQHTRTLLLCKKWTLSLHYIGSNLATRTCTLQCSSHSGTPTGQKQILLMEQTLVLKFLFQLPTTMANNLSESMVPSLDTSLKTDPPINASFFRLATIQCPDSSQAPPAISPLKANFYRWSPVQPRVQATPIQTEATSKQEPA